MPAKYRSRYAPRPTPRPRPAAAMPTGALVDAVLRFCDVQQDMGGGRVLKSLSPARVRSADVRAALGDAARQAGRVSILWNAREDEILRVMTAPAPERAAA